jgi:L-asparaginase II
MLLTCVVNEWSTGDYLDPTHPLQEVCRTAVEDLTGEKAASVGIDGCGAPVFALSLSGLARAFLACVDAAPDSPPRRVADAMRAFPELVSGTGRDDARLMRSAPGLLSKGGAEGVLAVALPGVGSVALKIDDGAARARTAALVPALGRLGVATAKLDAIGEVALLGGGRPVGSVRPIPTALISHSG